MFSKMSESLYSKISCISFDTLVWIIIGSFAAITLLVIILCLALPKMRSASKAPYLGLVNAYSAVVLAAFLTAQPLAQSAIVCAIFWCIGYLLYGFICLISKAQKKQNERVAPITLLPSTPPAPTQRGGEMYAAKSSVRLGHAIAVTDRLLSKNIGKSDRQELEKLKTTLSVLSSKGELTNAESDMLNDDFNALLKLMAKYDI